ncbi:Electron transfer flavoprotein beta subunit lysine methyltransferase [Eumeta japonica]|uniref:Electron transfer flavoprotein beta subunit lysine methyltransferase n=1 Tax=Eumeta variegata TaxID=151549 RepID=A0A4C1YHG6_EUMVA|nr:Electron transfer flavoprotein beta subunit lysine methyltransferase [Eumeta japonica]
MMKKETSLRPHSRSAGLSRIVLYVGYRNNYIRLTGNRYRGGGRSWTAFADDRSSVVTSESPRALPHANTRVCGVGWPVYMQLMHYKTVSTLTERARSAHGFVQKMHKDLATLILQYTRVSVQHLTPEIPLRLITPSSDLWRARLEDIPFPNDPFWGFYWPGGQAVARDLLFKSHTAADAAGEIRRTRLVSESPGGSLALFPLHESDHSLLDILFLFKSRASNW